METHKIESFEAFWSLYNHKKSREKCEKKWFSISAKDQVLIMSNLPQYIKDTPDKKYRKHPLTYLNSKSWLDEAIPNNSDKIYYKEPDPKPLSNYKPESFERSEFVQMLRGKFKTHFKTGVWRVIDYGGTIHNFLTEKGILKLSDQEKQDIKQRCQQEKERKRTRVESPYSGVLEYDIKSKEVKRFLDNSRGNGIRIDKMI